MTWSELENLKRFKRFDFSLYKYLIDVFGKRGDKAFFYVKERRVKRYRDFFVVVGREEYIVDERFCTCRDFQFNLKGRAPCAHIIAVEVARNLKMYDEVDAYYIDFTSISARRGWRFGG
ncbi:MAG: hypothetical protein GXO67_05810 [Archaeoglobi archaeon]|nr:hypothetical protein [Archaeoglobi archaeon]